MNLFKKILALAAALCFPLCFVGCNSNRGTYVAGDFVFNDNKDGGITVIEGLSEEGRQKEVLFVPKTMHNLPVKGIYIQTFVGPKKADFASKKLKKIYLHSELSIARNSFFDSSLEKKIPYEYYLNYRSYRDSNSNGTGYIPKKYYDTLNESNDSHFLLPANVEYKLNYNTDFNKGLHFIDDFDYGSRITFIPDDPIREGYTFGGWYTEDECINKWDFENNTLPELKTDENGETVYQGTILYAKWTQN